MARRRAPAGKALAPSPFYCQAVIEAAARAGKIKPEELTSPNRSSRVLVWRHAAIAIACDDTELSLALIGRRFGRHHSTVWSARQIARPELIARVRAELERPTASEPGRPLGRAAVSYSRSGSCL